LNIDNNVIDTQFYVKCVMSSTIRIRENKHKLSEKKKLVIISQTMLMFLSLLLQPYSRITKMAGSGDLFDPFPSAKR